MKGFIEGIKKILGNEGGFWIPLAVGALGGLAKGIADKKATKRHNLAQAELTKYSPWTGMQGQLKQAPSMFGSIMQGAGTGAMMGQALGGLGGATGAAGGAGKSMAMNTQMQSPWSQLAQSPTAIG